jgi:hypothetical protein
LNRIEEVSVPSWSFASTTTAVPLASVVPLMPSMWVAVAAVPIRVVPLSVLAPMLPM